GLEVSLRTVGGEPSPSRSAAPITSGEGPSLRHDHAGRAGNPARSGGARVRSVHHQHNAGCPHRAPGGERVAVSSSNPTQTRTYVLDTSVLLADPASMSRFAEHEVVIPIVVINELEAKRHHPELGYFAREALRFLDDLRVRHGRLDQPVPIGEGTIRVELNHSDPAVLP